MRAWSDVDAPGRMERCRDSGCLGSYQQGIADKGPDLEMRRKEESGIPYIFGLELWIDSGTFS